ncbi:MAG TPA: non-canonical purine NTP pyrophosphatase [Verrucomicrobiae bacterium]|jgi:inosine/xanthosine triphosphate pyrophosphatase family protein/diadenosine tetraphosphate (Ap4A) HIT family hydrolase
MVTLVTSNPAKYAAFAPDLERLRLKPEPPPQPLPEIQGLNFIETLTAKARAAAAMFGRPVIVDDTGLVLEAYPSFPGPLTATVLRSLGAAGLGRLLNGVSNRATMECHLGCWINGSLRRWAGVVHGQIDLSRQPRDPRMLLSDLFVPDASELSQPALQRAIARRAGESPTLLHRALALAALETDAFQLHLDVSAPENGGERSCGRRAGYDCPFCAELEGGGPNLFAELMGDQLSSRVVYEDEHFIVMPPLGEFMEGGLLVLTREHILSLAHLKPEQFEHLERLLVAIKKLLVKHWNVAPLVFEHGPAPDWSKGVCCVDHAHLNIFPALVRVHPHLADRMNFFVGSLEDLAQLRHAEFGYLFVQENDGARSVYDGQGVPTQLVRRFITAEIGVADRWHWRDYLGKDELLATYNALKGQIKL